VRRIGRRMGGKRLSVFVPISVVDVYDGHA
jgi:hypothetical protein